MVMTVIVRVGHSLAFLPFTITYSVHEAFGIYTLKLHLSQCTSCQDQNFIKGIELMICLGC